MGAVKAARQRRRQLQRDGGDSAATAEAAVSTAAAGSAVATAVAARRRRRRGTAEAAVSVAATALGRRRRRRLIPSLFSVDIIMITSTKSEHGDSPWCEPITPLFLILLEVLCTIFGGQKCMPVDGPSYLVARTDARVLTMFR